MAFRIQSSLSTQTAIEARQLYRDPLPTKLSEASPPAPTSESLPQASFPRTPTVRSEAAEAKTRARVEAIAQRQRTSFFAPVLRGMIDKLIAMFPREGEAINQWEVEFAEIDCRNQKRVGIHLFLLIFNFIRPGFCNTEDGKAKKQLEKMELSCKALIALSLQGTGESVEDFCASCYAAMRKNKGLEEKCRVFDLGVQMRQNAIEAMQIKSSQKLENRRLKLEGNLRDLQERQSALNQKGAALVEPLQMRQAQLHVAMAATEERAAQVANRALDVEQNMKGIAARFGALHV